MKWALIVLVTLLVVAGGVAGVLLLAEEDEPTFTETQAEAAVTRALKRCEHSLSEARRVSCRDVGNGFACRANGRFVAGFDYPDPEDPEFEVSC